jgi:hypothetical protein
MLTSRESDAIKLKALQQAMQAAHLAQMEPDPLLVVADAPRLLLTEYDLAFLKINRISPA